MPTGCVDAPVPQFLTTPIPYYPTPTPSPNSMSLKRSITLMQATAINMIDMVGIGPFVVIPLVIGYFNSPLFLWAWILGAFIALADGMIWSELGAAYPLARGRANFLPPHSPAQWGAARGS